MCGNEKDKRAIIAVLVGVLLLAGCSREPGSKVVTKGDLRIDVDEAVAPLMQAEVETFQQLYPDAKIIMRAVEAREAVANFAADSVRVIVTARALNKEERDALTAGKVQYEEWHVAQSAIAVIAHSENRVAEMRMGELDSIFTGVLAYWPGTGKRAVIDLVIGGVNSSTNEVFRTTVLGGKAFALGATPMGQGSAVLEYVKAHRTALGLVPVGWLQGESEQVTVISVSRPGVQADSTQPAGRPYSPAQAFVFKGWYPIQAPVYVYSREVAWDVSRGFIAFLTSAEGQRVVVKAGLVPVTMPVRLVQLTSDQVNEG